MLNKYGTKPVIYLYEDRINDYQYLTEGKK